MLHLKSQTSTDWIERVSERIDELLIDHAHCEKKAASTALSLLFRYPERAALLRPLSELAREELEHFELMLGVLDARGVVYRRLRPSPYAGQLMEAVRPSEPGRLVDTLLTCALIEARSCERMKLLSEALPDPELRALYAGLLASEARHHALYVELATQVAPRDEVRARLEVLAEHEASVVADAPPWSRMHT